MGYGYSLAGRYYCRLVPQSRSWESAAFSVDPTIEKCLFWPTSLNQLIASLADFRFGVECPRTPFLALPGPLIILRKSRVYYVSHFKLTETSSWLCKAVAPYLQHHFISLSKTSTAAANLPPDLNWFVDRDNSGGNILNVIRWRSVGNCISDGQSTGPGELVET